MSASPLKTIQFQNHLSIQMLQSRKIIFTQLIHIKISHLMKETNHLTLLLVRTEIEVIKKSLFKKLKNVK